MNSIACLRKNTEIPVFYARWELHKIISLSQQKKLNFVFLVNRLYSHVGPQMCLTPKLTCGWALGSPTTTHKACSSRDLGHLCGWQGQGQRQTPKRTHSWQDLLDLHSSTFRVAADELGAGFIPIASMTRTGNFTAALSTSWASLAIKLHVYVYCYKMKEWVGCSVSFNHLYFYIRLLNMLLHTHKSIWVTKDIEHCLPKTMTRREPVQAARAHGCSAVSFRLLSSAHKPSFIFIHRDLSACILKSLL